MLEFTAEVEHHGPRLNIQPFQIAVRHRRLDHPVAHDRLRVGGCGVVRLLLVELGRVLLVDFAKLGAGAADGLGGGGQRGVVGGGGVVGVPHLGDQVVELG
ncbi:hypothetical protein ACLQ26_17885 [Micromonospora sp. DT43]|uniref:hypothetical protein n=1 Tax=Micromonospora sp. DT43 TaxID=3393440 RepID=UPI003CF990AD